MLLCSFKYFKFKSKCFYTYCDKQKRYVFSRGQWLTIIRTLYLANQSKWKQINKKKQRTTKQKKYDIRQMKAMFEGKDMAECFVVMYVNHNKSIECLREENFVF